MARSGQPHFTFAVLASGAGAGDAAATFPEAIASTYVTTCQRFSSGRNAHDGIPLSLSPLVTNQNTSPEVTPFNLPSTREGTLPVPLPAFP